MKNSIVLIAVSAAALLASASSMAQGDNYVQAQLGTGGMKLSNSKLAQGTQTTFNKKNDLSKMGDQIVPRVSIGHYFMHNGPMSLGAELGYTKYGDQSYKSTDGTDHYKVKYKRQDLDLMGVAKYDVTDQFFVNGKLGVAYANQKVSMSDAYLSQVQATDGLTGSKNNLTKSSQNKKAFKPKFSLGAGYNLTKELAATVSYDHTFGNKPTVAIDGKPSDSSISRLASADVVSVGFTYSF